MPYFICSLPDDKSTRGRRPSLITDDPARLDAFRKRWDRPGRSTYRCVSLLRDGAVRRSLEDVAALLFVHVDIDYRTVATPPDEIDRILRQLPLAPEIRDSGGGRHLVWWLKEPVDAGTLEFDQIGVIRTALTSALAGDPAPNHAAALLREPGSRNFKYGKPRLCQVLQEAPPADITELAELAALLDGVQLIEPLKPAEERPPPKRKGNGRDHGSDLQGMALPCHGWKVPVDVDARLAGMRFQGPGDTSIHFTQLQCMGSLIRCGCPLDDATHAVLEATRQCVRGIAEAQAWDWEVEQRNVRRMGTDLINKNPELAPMLPGAMKARWDAKVAAGLRPRVDWTPAFGWRVAGDRPRKSLSEEKAARDRSGREQEETQKGAAPRDDLPKPPWERATRAVLELRPFIPFDPATLPQREWLYGRHYQRRTVSLTAGPGGMGKTSLAMVEIVAMVTGRNLLGEQPSERLRIWLHNGEDPLEEIYRRLAAICLHYAIPQEELAGYLWVTSGNEFPLKVARGYTNLEINAALVQQISGAVGTNRIDLAAFDPLVTVHEVSEGDPGKMDAVVRLFAGIADEHNAAVDLSHHVRKPAAGADSDHDHDVFDIRGVKAITDAARAVRVLNRMNAKDAESAGIGDITRLSHFRVDRAKGNYSPAQAATWRRFVSVDLPNGDSVGVVEPWDFPGQGAPTPEKAAADRKAEEVFLQLLDKFTARGINVSANVGPTFAPAKFADEREAKNARCSKAALKAAMSRLLDSGRIRSEPYGRGDHPNHRLVPWQGAALNNE